MHLDVHVHMSKCICMCVLNPMVAAAAASSKVVLIVAMNVDLKIDFSIPNLLTPGTSTLQLAASLRCQQWTHANQMRAVDRS